MYSSSPRFCPECGAALSTYKVGAEARKHAVCEACTLEVHEHPTVVVTSFVAYQKSLLWVRRAIEPKQGLWAIPGGFLEAGERVAEGAARELREEAGLVIPPADLHFYMMGSLTFINQIYIGFRTTVNRPDCNPGAESMECAFFSRTELPWDEVAYPEVNRSIEQAYEDLERGRFRQWHVEMTPERYDQQIISHNAASGPVQ